MKPVLLSLPDELMTRLRIEPHLGGLQLRPVNTQDSGDAELKRLWGPFEFNADSPFELWIARPGDHAPSVLLCAPKRQNHRRYKRLVGVNETLVAVGWAKFGADVNDADVAARTATIQTLLGLGARDVTQRDSLLFRMRETIGRAIISLFSRK